MGFAATGAPPTFEVPYGAEPTSATGQARGFFSARYTGVTVVPSNVSDLDALRNGRIMLSDDAATRFDEVLAAGRRPLPAPPAERSELLQPL